MNTASLLKLCLLLLLITSDARAVAVPVDETPVRGLWRSPGNPGHGVDLQREPGTTHYVMLWYTYDLRGEGTWYLGDGRLEGDRIVMRLLAMRLVGAERVQTEVGQAEWLFNGHQEAVMHWRIGSRAGSETLVPFAIARGLTPLPLTGIWHDAGDSGWGMSVATAGETRAVIVYYYGRGGMARWALGAGPAADVDVALFNYTGTCPGCARMARTLIPAGSVALAPQLQEIGVDLKIMSKFGPWRRLTGVTRLTEPLYPVATPERAEAGDVLAFSGVNVLPMDRDVVLADHVVVTRAGLIDSVQPRADADVPQGARLIVHPGAYLLPGLTDAHVHLPSIFSNASDLFVFLAYGVTTVRNMWGNTLLVSRRDALAAGNAFAPRLFTASPGIESPGFWPGTVEVRTPAAAKTAVSQLFRDGYDFIKIYNNQTPAVYTAIVEQSSLLGIDMVGHIPFNVDLMTALAGPQRSIEHLRGYPPRVTSARVDSWNTTLDIGEAQRWAEETVTADTWNAPTQVALEHTPADVPLLMKTPAYRALSPSYKSLLNEGSNRPFSQPALSIQNERAMIRLLAEAGAPLLIGTDAGVRFALPGYSVHEEMQIFDAAGVDPFTTLRSATVEFARFMRAEDHWGSIRAGLDADLLLVDGNPLEDIAVLLDGRLGVMARGSWISRAAIDAKLAELAD